MDKDYQKANTDAKESIEKAMIDNGLNGFFIQNRIKSQESIQKKMKIKDDFDQVKEITDYSGIRIILIQLFEVRKCIEIITEKFKIDYFNSNLNPHSFISENQFGYRSSHIVIEENNVKTEIQIRTLSQHIWASISHPLDYKSTKKDTIFRRKLFRLSSLLEQVDISIDDLYETAPVEKKSNLLSLGNLDHYSLEYYLSRKEKLFALIIYSFKGEPKPLKEREKIKLSLPTNRSLSFKILDGSDAAFQNDKHSLKLILSACKKLQLNNIEELQCFLLHKITYARKIRKAYNLSKLPFSSNAFKVFLFLIVFTSKKDEKIILEENGFDENFAKEITNFTDRFKKIIE